MGVSVTHYTLLCKEWALPRAFVQETTISYLVCHMEKYHKQNVAPIERENERDENYKSDNPQIDSSKTKYNYHKK